MLLEEQETVITFDKSSDLMNIYTADKGMMAKLDKLPAYERHNVYRSEGKIVAADYRADKRLITLRSKRKVMTEEQKNAAKERFKKKNPFKK